MDVAKRLQFDTTETLAGANQEALDVLQQAVQDLSTAAKQKRTQMLDLAKQTAEQGIGDNDLKRLKRQFDSNKATYVNIEQKERFMKGLYGLEVDIEQLTAAKDQYEQQLEREAEALRGLKAQNEQARAKLGSTAASISQLYGLVEQTTAATGSQLEATSAVLQQAASSRPAEEAAAEPGPEQAQAQALVEAEAATAKELERCIAAAEAELSELEGKAGAGRQELTALRAEVERLELLASDRVKAADADSHTRSKAQWCEDLLALRTKLSGLSVLSSSSEEVVLGICLKLPTARQPAVEGAAAAAVPVREVQHELQLQLLPCTSSSGVLLSGARLSPAAGDVRAFLDAAVNGSQVSLSHLVCEVRGRLLCYWSRQVLVEAAAEVYPPCSSSRGPPHVRVALPNQVEVEVLVPFAWPCSSSERLQLVQLACPQVDPAAAVALVDSINANRQLLLGGDLLGLLRAVAEATEAQLLDAEAANM
ncbi:hypothetical protein COO60DRAFT_559993 [Scenedesmus sp. NREL 46B-D3]|nr:hypothetical protein COO60DRAFT_559993 [Scenedesmus sp. NREL 46B-D3]